uniref:Uncharacterized protein n=1 Tax=Anguilla anguilla TaxID=7936 RepID=A0A0E9WXC0_ANGAN
MTRPEKWILVLCNIIGMRIFECYSTQVFLFLYNLQSDVFRTLTRITLLLS